MRSSLRAHNTAARACSHISDTAFGYHFKRHKPYFGALRSGHVKADKTDPFRTVIKNKLCAERRRRNDRCSARVRSVRICNPAWLRKLRARRGACEFFVAEAVRNGYIFSHFYFAQKRNGSNICNYSRLRQTFKILCVKYFQHFIRHDDCFFRLVPRVNHTPLFFCHSAKRPFPADGRDNFKAFSANSD